MSAQETDDVKLRREAMQIAIQLPTKVEDAIQVLRYAAELVDFTQGKAAPQSAVLKLVKPTCSGS